MALASYALTTYQAVLDRLQLSSHSNPGLIERMINSASWEIIQYTGREFKPLVSTSLVRKFPFSSSGYVSFSPSEALTISQLKANVEGTAPTTLAATDYQTFIAGSGSISGLRLVTNYSRPALGFQGMVEVTGTWGWASVPPDVVAVCEWQVVQWVRRDLQSRSDTLASDDESLIAAPPYPGLSRLAMSALSRYRVPVVA